MPSPAQPSRIVSLILAVAGGLLADAAFPQRGLWPLAIAAVALLLLALRRDHAGWGFLVGTVWGLSFLLVHIWWANDSVGVVPWVALSTAQALAVGATAASWIWVRRIPVLRTHPWWGVLAFAAVFAAWEVLRSAAPFGGFPWGRLAYAQSTGPLLRLASLGGVVLVTFVVAALGAALALGIVALRRGGVLRASLAAIVVVAVPALAVLVPLDTSAQAGTTRVGFVQGNVANPGLGAFANAREVVENHTAGTLTLAEDYAGELDVVLWPENASDYNPREDAEAGALVEEAAEAIGAPILLGTQSYLRDEDGNAVERYNDYVLWEPEAGAVAAYAKQRPAPFAEYIPMRDIARRFSSAVDLVTVDMAPGQEEAVLDVTYPDDRIVPWGIGICFEVAYDDVMREAVLAGAQVLVVPTNNASYGYTAESEQQLAMTAFRAVELGRAAVQVSTVGVSGVVSPNGVVTQETELFTAAQGVAELPLRTGLTLAARIGPWPAYTVVAATAVLLVAAAAHGVSTRARAPRRRVAA